ncbi:hypothetical protein QQ045_010895 [Rhodiola kirilowii]
MKKLKLMDPTADSVPELCADLIQEILLKLPIKRLIRFKLVSKTWQNIITSHYFTSKHYNYSLGQSSGSNNYSDFFILQNPDSLISSISVRRDLLECIIHHGNIRLPYLERKREEPPTHEFSISMMFSAGLGLYCVFDSRSQRAALWNPATSEIKVLPSLPLYDIEDHIDAGFVYIFGHAEIKDGILSYKLGLLTAMYDTIKKLAYYSLDLYDSNSNSWKVLTWGRHNTTIRYPHNWEDYGVNLNGVFHHRSTDSKRLPYIMTFDYNSEVFSRLEVPDDLHQITGQYFWNRSHLTLYDDKFLCLVICRKKEFLDPILDALIGSGVSFDVWVMREYGIKESWSREYTTTGNVVNNMNIVNYSKRIGGIFLQNDKGALYLCDCPSPALRLRNICPGFGKWKEMRVLERTESLVSINEGSG